MIQEALDKIEELLRPVCTALEIELLQFSQTQEQRGRAWQKEMLIIHLGSISYAPPKQAQKLNLNDCTPIQQIATANFELVLHSKILRNNRGTIYDAIEQIKAALNGKRIQPLAGPAFVTNIEYRQLKESRFYLYALNLQYEFKEQSLC